MRDKHNEACKRTNPDCICLTCKHDGLRDTGTEYVECCVYCKSCDEQTCRGYEPEDKE